MPTANNINSKGPGYMDASVIGCQFSVYPLKQADIDVAVQGVIKAAGEHCDTRVQNLSTLLQGNEEQVFAALRAAFRKAHEYGPAVMVATLAAGMPTDELVADIQTEIKR